MLKSTIKPDPGSKHAKKYTGHDPKLKLNAVWSKKYYEPD
jgi:hypothetical protein